MRLKEHDGLIYLSLSLVKVYYYFFFFLIFVESLILITKQNTMIKIKSKQFCGSLKDNVSGEGKSDEEKETAVI